MHHRTVFAAMAATVSVLLSTRPVLATDPGLTPATGFRAHAAHLSAEILAAGPNGMVAASRSTSEGAEITVYNHAAPAGRKVVASLRDPSLKFVGGIAFGPRNTLLVSENGTLDTVLAYPLAGGAPFTLAPMGSMPNVSQVRVRQRDNAVFAIAANAPGQGVLYRIANGQAFIVAAGLGHGYLGGLAFDRAGNIYLGDTNDPNFQGLPGRVLVMGPKGEPRGTISLEGGRGTGIYDLAVGSDGSLYATTGATLTRAYRGRSTEFGRFTGFFSFPTDIALQADGSLLVNAMFTGAADTLEIRAETLARQPRGGLPSPPPAGGLRPQR